MRTEEVYCCVCGEKIAWWGGGFNKQYQDELICDNEKLRRRVPANIVKTKHSTTFTMGGGEELFRSEDKGGLKYEYLHCAISNNSVYCRKCAQKLHYHCKNCRKGRIKLDRKG